MCPEFEMIDRQVTNDVSLFEAQIPFNPPNGKLIIDPSRAVKKFRRSAAGNYELSEDLRPPEILLATTAYLMKDVLGDSRWPANGVSFSVLYAFIRDRLRAIRTDLTLQACKTLHSIRIHELSIRFLIAAGHLLCEEDRAAFEPQQNTEQLNGCLSALREMYKAVRITNNSNTATWNAANSNQMLKYEAEFQAYAIILSVDKKEAAIAISSLPIDLLSNPHIQVALEAYSTFQQSNFIKFLSLIRTDPRTSYFQACLLHQFVLPIRQRALNALIALSDCYKLISKDDFARWLAFVDAEELLYYSDRFGFGFQNNFVDLNSLAARGEAIDLRAEEENFRIRKFQADIEDQRRSSQGLHEIIFKEFDLNVAEILGILQTAKPKKSDGITSEFLMAASASPVAKKEPVKKFFTASRLATVSESSSSNVNLNGSFESTKGPDAESAKPLNFPAAVLNAPPPLEAPKIDHQAILRKKLEAQAQERQKRKETISGLSGGMLEALIGSVVSVSVSEICSLTWDSVLRTERDRRKRLIEDLSAFIYKDLLENCVIPGVIDVDLLLIRCRAAEACRSKNSILNQVNFAIINSLENELLEEFVNEAFMEAKCLKFVKSKWMRKMLRKKSSVLAFDWKRDLFDFVKPLLIQPVHLVLLDCNINNKPAVMKSLLEPLLKANPPNPLGYLQSFSNFELKMLWSDNSNSECPFVLSYLASNSTVLDLFNWPTNYPGPTVLILPDEGFEVNFSEFPWQPQVVFLNDFSGFGGGATSERFKEVFEYSLKVGENAELPRLYQNLKFSDLIPEEFIKSFVEDLCENSEELRSLLLSELVERIFFVLFKTSQAAKLLSWHPITAGRSAFLDALRKSSNVPEKFVNLLRSNGAFQTTSQILDSIYGNVFTCNLESLYTNQSISDLIRSQNEVIARFNDSGPTKKSKIAFNEYYKQQHVSIDDLHSKLKSEASQSQAYESFLKKFL